MNNIVNTLRYNWHPMRIIYLVLAIAVFAQAWQAREWTFGLLGGLFLYQSLFNVGCCGVGGSFRQDDKRSVSNSIEDTEYIEIK